MAHGDTSHTTRPTQIPVYQMLTDVILSQGAPVQNTWYTVLDLQCSDIIFGYRILGATVAVATTGETLQMRMTIDGIPNSGSVAAGAGSIYQASFDGNIATPNALILASGAVVRTSLIDCKNVKIEVRKTTANGVGTLSSKVIHQKLAY